MNPDAPSYRTRGHGTNICHCQCLPWGCYGGQWLSQHELESIKDILAKSEWSQRSRRMAKMWSTLFEKRNNLKIDWKACLFLSAAITLRKPQLTSHSESSTCACCVHCHAAFGVRALCAWWYCVVLIVRTGAGSTCFHHKERQTYVGLEKCLGG